MKALALVCLAGVLSLSALGNTLDFELIPRGKPFRLTFADPREIRMVISFEANSRIQAAVGNYFSLIGLRAKDEAGVEEWFATFGIEGGGFFSLRQGPSATFPLETVDGLFGLYAEGRKGPWQAQLRFTHVSAHLADGSQGKAIPHSRETVIGRVGYEPIPEVHLYSGIKYIANTIPTVRPWGIQFGATAFWPGLQSKLVPFTAFDLQWREEAPRNPALAFQLGVALNSPPEAYRSFRFFYGYYTGQDPRGQYQTQLFTAHSLGVEMQI